MAVNGGAASIDRALSALIDALSRNPYAFPDTGVKEIRLARTKIVMSAGGVVPALSIRFRCDDVSRTVSLLHLEVTMPDDLEYDDEWPWR